ncbi:unnamed protein product, partial [Rotaria magnacalcarata]
MNFLFRQQRTFKPHRNIPEGIYHQANFSS